MSRRIGGLLVMVLGAVLMTGGLAGGQGVTVGATPTPCLPTIGTANPCPTGTITFTESTVAASTANAQHALRPHAPTSWTVTITSSCALPSGGTSDVVTVPDGGTATSDPLFVYADQSDTTLCSYTLTTPAVAGYTASFDPPSPVTLPAPSGRGTSDRAVSFVNTAATPATTSTPATTTTTATTTTASAAPTVRPSSASVAPTRPTDPGSTLPFTGPRHRVGTLFALGLALFVGGLVLTVAAGRRRPGSHRS